MNPFGVCGASGCHLDNLPYFPSKRLQSDGKSSYSEDIYDDGQDRLTVIVILILNLGRSSNICGLLRL